MFEGKKSKSDIIRSLLNTREWTTSEIAKQTNTSPRVVRAVRQRWHDHLDPTKTPRSLSQIRERLRSLEARVRELEAMMRAACTDDPQG